MAERYKVAIRRNGRVVDITLTFRDDYAGIEPYDNLMQSVRNGLLRLKVKLGAA